MTGNPEVIDSQFLADYSRSTGKRSATGICAAQFHGDVIKAASRLLLPPSQGTDAAAG